MNSNTTSHKPISRKPIRRTALVAGLTAALVLPLGLTASAQTTTGASTRSAAQRTVSGKPSDSVTRIADFYGAYIDAQSDPDHGARLASELRKFYVQADYLKKVEAWEARNHADGVLQAQNVPLKWTVTDNGRADHTEAVVTLSWSGTTTKLIVDMSRSQKIIHIGTKGIDGK
ncbi:hypothetical protein [Streptomyces sp. NPDC090798]|uniref:hypothetical protein n=1 Tax=Streptomyces sp. NPDC090798 TaxID=3365968 RepID=UPI0037FA3D77